jgi:hypothetical protein
VGERLAGAWSATGGEARRALDENTRDGDAALDTETLLLEALARLG